MTPLVYKIESQILAIAHREIDEGPQHSSVVSPLTCTQLTSYDLATMNTTLFYCSWIRL